MEVTEAPKLRIAQTHSDNEPLAGHPPKAPHIPSLQLPPRRPPSDRHGETFSLVGVAGWVLEVKHGGPILVDPFTRCGCLSDVLNQLGAMGDAQLLGTGLFAVMLAGSTVSLAIGVTRICRRLWHRWESGRAPYGPKAEP